MARTDILLIVLACLAAYLVASMWRRHHAESARRQQAEAERQLAWARERAGNPPSASTILPEIERLRGDYLPVARSHSRRAFTLRGLIAAARQAVASLPYFREGSGAKPESSDHKD